ncbi:hypothetical protein BKA93DRAFT_813167 [Sparassis latifolia]
MHETYMNIMLADLVNRAQEILTAFHLHPKTTATTVDWTLQLARSCYSGAVQMLTRKEHGWHFSAANTKPEQIHDFRIEDMAEKMRTITPDLWEMVHFLLSGKDSMDTDTEMELDSREPDLEERQYWESEGMEDVWVGPDEVAAEVQQEEKDQKAAQKKRESHEVLTTIKTVVIISILMQNCVQHCNALQSTIGIFLHSCNTPEKLIKVLAHMGISISLTFIHRAICSLSIQTSEAMQTLGQTYLASYAYNNFDIKFNTAIPTVENPVDTLAHLTSGTVFRLAHGVTADDLRCSKLLWDRSPLTSAKPNFYLKGYLNDLNGLMILI